MSALTNTRRTSRSGLRAAPAVVGVGYSLSWLAGLTVSAPSPALHAGGREIVSRMSGHGTAVTVQFLFTEGLPAIGLLVVPMALAAAGRWRGAARVAGVAAIAAAAISLVQFLCGLGLAHTTSPGTAHLLYESVNRGDGVKMFALAVVGAAAARSGLLPRWLNYTGVVLAVSIAGSGIGYLFLLPSMSTLAYISLPALLVFVTGAGIALTRKDR